MLAIDTTKIDKLKEEATNNLKTFIENTKGNPQPFVCKNTLHRTAAFLLTTNILLQHDGLEAEQKTSLEATKKILIFTLLAVLRLQICIVTKEDVNKYLSYALKDGIPSIDLKNQYINKKDHITHLTKETTTLLLNATTSEELAAIYRFIGSTRTPNNTGFSKSGALKNRANLFMEHFSTGESERTGWHHESKGAFISRAVTNAYTTFLNVNDEYVRRLNNLHTFEFHSDSSPGFSLLTPLELVKIASDYIKKTDNLLEDNGLQRQHFLNNNNNNNNIIVIDNEVDDTQKSLYRNPSSSSSD